MITQRSPSQATLLVSALTKCVAWWEFLLVFFLNIYFVFSFIVYYLGQTLGSKLNRRVASVSQL